MTVQLVDGGPTLIQQCGDVTWFMGAPHVKSRNILLHARWTTRRDDDLWAGVVHQSQWNYAGLQMIDSSTSSDSRPWIRRSTKTAIVFYYIISLLGIKQSSSVCHQQTPFTSVKLQGPCLIDKEPFLRVVISNSHELVKVPSPYTYSSKYILLI